jgi:hypothetical protein
MGDGHRAGDDGIAAETRLVRRAVQRNQRGIQPGLVADLAPREHSGDLAIDCGQRALHVVTTEGRTAVARSTASALPVDAPAGAMARPVRPSAKVI